MIAALNTWNAERAAAGDTPLAIGIGLHLGPAVIGDVGSERSQSFTVIGDTVNTASRLQVLTRDFATPLVVSDALVAAVHAAPTDGGRVFSKGSRTGAPRLCAAAAPPSCGRCRVEPGP